MITIHRVRNANPALSDDHVAYLSSESQAAELVLHGIIVPDGTFNSDALTVHWYRKAD